MTMSIEIEHLSKTYKGSRKKALNSVSAIIPDGIFCLLGENGAGKTTLLKTLSTVMPIQEGNIRINNKDLADCIVDIRQTMGYLPQRFDFFEHLTAYEMLEYIAMLKGVRSDLRNKEIKQLLEEFNLSDKRKTQIRKLSGGMKQRLAIAQTLIGESQYVILDEPTVGLDPNERLRFRNIISRRSVGRTIIISTHIISDVAMLCDNLGIMRRGEMIYCGSVVSLLEKAEKCIYVDNISLNEIIDKDKYPGIISILRKKDSVEVRFISETDLTGKYSLVTPTLEDAYFYCLFLCEA